MKDIEYHPRAVKALRRYRSDAARIRSKVLAYAADPASQANNIKRLKGSNATFRLRVGDYRVIFAEDRTSIIVIDIGPRGAIYDQ